MEVLEKCLFYFQDSCSGWSVHAFAISAGPTGSILDRIDCIIYHKKFLFKQEVAFADCVKRDQMKKCLANFLLPKKMDFQFINTVW